MDAGWFDYCLSDDERLEFEENGFFIVENALPPEMVDNLIAVVDPVGFAISGSGWSAGYGPHRHQAS